MINKNMKKSDAFTIIELLVVITIISILIALSVTGASIVRRRARDASRKNDLAKAQGVLTLYYSDKKTYPLPCGVSKPCFYDGNVGGYDLMMNGSGSFPGLRGNGYTDTKIQDEKFLARGTADGYAYRYRPSADGLSFELSAKLENSGDGDLENDATGAGSDDTRYERGTEKSNVTQDCLDATSCSARDVYSKIDGTADSYTYGGTNYSWIYDFDQSRTCSDCKME